MGTLFSYFEGTLEEYLSYIRKNQDNHLIKIRLAPASTVLETTGIVTPSYYHVLNNFAVKHIMRRHGNNRELLRGQCPISADDFLTIPKILNSPDSISQSICKNGNPAIIYTAELGDETDTLIEEVRTGHAELAVSTLYKRKKKLTDAKSPEDSADSGFAPFRLQR